MKHTNFPRLLTVLSFCLVLITGSVGQIESASGQTSLTGSQAVIEQSFTFQGQLANANGSVTGNCDLEFSLFDAAIDGTQIGSTQTVRGVNIAAGGHFSLVLNRSGEFTTNPFPGDKRWLQTSVRCPAGNGSYASLSPRQELSAVPYAITASNLAALGNIGIGTQNPLQKLHVIGARIRLENGGKILDLRTDGGLIDIQSETTAIVMQSIGNELFLNPNLENRNVVVGTFGNAYGKLVVRATEPQGNLRVEPLPTAANLYGVVGQVDYTILANLECTDPTVPGCVGRHETAGVYGRSNATNGSSGVLGEGPTGVLGSGRTGVQGNGVTGVHGHGIDGIGVHGTCEALVIGCSAGYFEGNVAVNGHLSKASGSFKIDHPLDPANKFLYHSFVESPDMLNIYNGNTILDSSGEAWVDLPAWFEALNQDFRYQLTAVGTPGPNLYIAQEIRENRFKVAGGQPDAKVSWQVTGIRHDPYANAHRVPVEEEKSMDERGKYLHPAEWNQPPTSAIEPMGK